MVIVALAAALAGRAEIIDRIAVTVDELVITESDILRHLRIASFLNDEPLRATMETKREAASRLMEQVLVRREMEISRYPAPEMSDIEPMVERLRAQWGGEDGLRQALNDHHLTEQELRQGLLLQLTMLRFIDFRFRPGITVTDEEVDQYYQTQVVPDARSAGNQPPALDDIRDTVEEILVQQRVTEALDRWLEQASSTARVRYREEAFQ